MSNIDPVIPTLPKLQSQLQRKYQGLQPALQTLPPSITSSLLAIDTTRVARGQAPLTNPETINAVGAAVTGRPVTPAPERDDSLNPLNLVSNFARDVLAIGRSIPHLPGALVDEVKDLPNFSQIAAEEGFFNAPGVRLIPGAYTANAIAQGDPLSTVAQHPGFFLSDIIPAVKGAKSIPLGEGRTVGSVVRAAPPIAAAEDVLRSAGRELAATRPGQFYQSAFGRPGRDIARLHAESQHLYREAALHPTSDLSGTPYADTPEAALARRAREAMDTYSSIPAERQAALSALAQTEDWKSALSTLPDLEASYLQFIRDGFDELAAIEGTRGMLVNFKGEWYDRSTGRKLVRKQEELDTATTLNTIRHTITNPLPTSPEATSTLTQTVTDILSSDTLPRKVKRDALRGVSFSLDAAGFNGQLFREQLGLMGKSPNLNLDPALSSLTSTFDLGPNFGTLTADQLVTALSPHRRNPNIRLAIDNIRSGAFSRARENVNAYLTSSSSTGFDIVDIPDHISRLSQQQKFLSQTSQYSDKAVNRLRTKHERRMAREVPARHAPLIQEKIRQGVLERHATDPNFAEIEGHIRRGEYSVSPEIQATAKQLANEFRSTWPTLKAEGHDPIFVAHVSPSAARTINFPTIPLGPRTPSYVKKRQLLDAAPYSDNMLVALTHSAQEALGRIGAEHFVDQFTSMYGKRRYAADGVPGVEDLYRAKVEAEAAVNPSLNVRNRMDELINREWEAFDPNSLIPWRKARSTSLSAQDQILVPRAMSRTLKDIYNPKTYAVQGILDPTMNLFRTSVLALSPRWHFNNMFGNAAILAFEDPRIFFKLPQAIRMMRGADIALPDGTTVSRQALSRRGIVGTGAGSLPAEVREWTATGKLPSNTRIAQIAHQHAAGRTLRRLLNSSGKVIDKSYALNAWVDDMFRSATYLHGYSQALKSGSKKVNLKSLMGDLLPPDSPTTITREAA